MHKGWGIHHNFFPEQVSFIEREERFTINIRPSLVEANLDKDEYLRLKKYSAEPSNNWLYERAEGALSDFINFGDEFHEKETQWKALKKEMDIKFKKKYKK